MRRNEVWRALDGASNRLQDAVERWFDSSGPQDRLAAERAVADYVEKLTPVVGTGAAFDYQAKYTAFVESNDRLNGLLAALALGNSDEGDLELLARLQTRTGGCGGGLYRTSKIASPETCRAGDDSNDGTLASAGESRPLPDPKR
jgi:hypothetical protein